MEKLNRSLWPGCEACRRPGCETCAYNMDDSGNEPCLECENASEYVPRNYCSECGRPLTEEACAELAARLASAQPPNLPLTQAELRSLNREPVYLHVQSVHGAWGEWVLVRVVENDDGGEEIWFVHRNGILSTPETVMRHGGSFYRRKPEEDKNDGKSD